MNQLSAKSFNHDSLKPLLIVSSHELNQQLEVELLLFISNYKQTNLTYLFINK